MFDPVEKLQPESPAASVLGVRAFGDPGSPGFSCAKLAIQEVISAGTCTICIIFGLREGWREVSIDISLASLRAKSRDRQSVTTLSIPGGFRSYWGRFRYRRKSWVFGLMSGQIRTCFGFE